MKLDIKNAFAITGIVACICILAAIVLICAYLPPVVSAMIDIPDPVSIEERAMMADDIERIDRLLARYPAETRKIVYLYFAEDMKLQEIAASMDLPLSTVKSRLYRTLRDLKKKAEGR